MDEFGNVYDDRERARAYSQLTFPGTYYLAFRDLPALFDRHVRGRNALDFGCGAGRSTRFLQKLGFEAAGIDISRPMLEEAAKLDPGGRYYLVEKDGPGRVEGAPFDLILAAFTFDNFPGLEKRRVTLGRLRELLSGEGKIVIIVSAPEIYLNEWVSFSTRNYPQNRNAGSGDRVLIEILDVDDPRPVEDTLCFHEDYLRIFKEAGFSAIETVRPLANGDQRVEWVSEDRIAPWVIYVLVAV